MPPIQLAQRQKIEGGDEHPHPPREGGETQVERGAPRHQPIPDRRGQEGLAKMDGLAGKDHVADAFQPGHIHPLRRQVPPHHDAGRHEEPGQGAGRPDVEQLPAVQHRAPERDERPEAADRGQVRGNREEVGWRDLDGVPAGCQVVPHLVHEEDPEEGEGEAPAVEHETPVSLDDPHEKLGGTLEGTGQTGAIPRVPSACQGGAGPERADDGQGEEQPMQPPARPGVGGDGAHQHDSTPVAPQPVMGTVPAGERGPQCRTGPPVLDADDAVHEFPGAEADGTPGGQVRQDRRERWLLTAHGRFASFAGKLYLA